jgi:hypothetical protein
VLYVIALLAAAFAVPALLLRLLEPMRGRRGVVLQEGVVSRAHPYPATPSMLIIGLLAAAWFYRDRAAESSQIIGALTVVVFLGIFVNSWFGYVVLTSSHLRYRRSLLSPAVELRLTGLGAVDVRPGMRAQSVSVTDAQQKVHQLGLLPTGREFARQLESAIREAQLGAAHADTI